VGINFQISNIVVNENKSTTIFIGLSNGEVNNQTFASGTTLNQIQAWIQSRVDFFEQREIDLLNQSTQLIEDLQQWQ